MLIGFDLGQLKGIRIAIVVKTLHTLCAHLPAFPRTAASSEATLKDLMTTIQTIGGRCLLDGLPRHVQLTPAFRNINVSRPSTARLGPVIDDFALCQVTYSSSDHWHSSHHVMPAAARSAFKDLEYESGRALNRSRFALSAAAVASPTEQSAIDTLCLVTYSDEEDAACAWQQQQQQRSQMVHSHELSAASTPGAVQTVRAAAFFEVLCSSDQTDEATSSKAGAMDTLCILSYDEEAS